MSPRAPLDHAGARRLIDAFLVDDLLEQDAARLAAHVEGCPACAAEIGGATRLLALLGSLPTPPPAPDLDERIYAAAIADRAHRHDHHSWLANLKTQVFRGAIRTTGTLMVAIVTVAFLGGAFVLASAYFTQSAPPTSPRVTVTPDMTTPAPTMVRSTAPAETPPAVVATPAPTAKGNTGEYQAPAPTPVPSASPAATEPSATPAPSPSATAEPSPTPTPSPTPSPTEKPRRTPPPSASPSPTPTPAPTLAPTPTLP